MHAHNVLFICPLMVVDDNAVLFVGYSCRSCCSVEGKGSAKVGVTFAEENHFCSPMATSLEIIFSSKKKLCTFYFILFPSDCHFSRFFYMNYFDSVTNSYVILAQSIASFYSDYYCFSL